MVRRTQLDIPENIDDVSDRLPDDVDDAGGQMSCCPHRDLLQSDLASTDMHHMHLVQSAIDLRRGKPFETTHSPPSRVSALAKHVIWALARCGADPLQHDTRDEWHIPITRWLASPESGARQDDDSSLWWAGDP